MLGVARAIARHGDSAAGTRNAPWAHGVTRTTAGAGWVVTIAGVALCAGASFQFSEFRTDFPRSEATNGSLRAASARGASGSAVHDRSQSMQFTIHAAAASVATMLATCADAADIRVPQDFATIQAAVDAANAGDRVLVAPGTYAPFTFHAKHVTVESTGGASATTIDATGMQVSAVSFEAGTGFDTVLRGFRVLTGAGTRIGEWLYGGGCFLLGDIETRTPACATIEGCVFVGATGNTGYGAGIYANWGNIALRDCVLTDLHTDHHGAAIDLHPIATTVVPGTDQMASVIEHCTVRRNGSYNDGGILIGHNDSSRPMRLRIAHTEFLDNHASYSTGALIIGSIPGGADGDYFIEGCHFAGNTGSYGSSITIGIPQSQSNQPSNLHVTDCLFEDGGTAIQTSHGRSTTIARSAFCSGSGAIASPYVDAGGNSFTCDLSTDCDRDGVADLISTTLGQVADTNHDHVPDACQCTGDINRDGVVNGSDLGGLLAFWGPNPAFPRADLNGDGRVDGSDLGLLLAGWGPCGQ
jgi:hypothetical protein